MQNSLAHIACRLISILNKRRSPHRSFADLIETALADLPQPSLDELIAQDQSSNTAISYG